MSKATHCDICGAELWKPEDRMGETMTCGAAACDREARANARQEREEAHEALDYDRGWGGHGW